MKIIQSFWTKPGNSRENDWNGNLKRGESGGWIDIKSYYRSWALSCLTLRKYYNEVELVTDSIGKRILIDQLELPYTSVKLDLDDLSEEHPDLWALGKIYTYSLQKEPFLHVDSDVFIWDRIFNINQSGLLVQNFERHFYFYDILKKYREAFQYYPACLEKHVGAREEVYCVNAGVLGGNDFVFIQEYAQLAMKFVNENRKYFSRINVAEFNMIFEQILFYYLAQEKALTIKPLFPDRAIVDYETMDYEWVVDFEGVPMTTKYIHAIGPYKRDVKINNLVARYLEGDFPAYSQRIEEFIS